MKDKEKILNLFIENSEKEFHVREISRTLKLSPTTASKYLKELEKKGFLLSEEKFRHLIFKSSDNLKFKSKKIEYNLSLIRESGLIDYLIENYEPETIILFGSFAKGENTKKSDIDLLVISSVKKELELNKFESKLSHPIQVFLHSKSDIERIKKNNKELLNNWLNGIKLHGYFELFR